MVRFKTKKVRAGVYVLLTQKKKGSRWVKAGAVWRTPTDHGPWAGFTKKGHPQDQELGAISSQGTRTKGQAIEWLKQWFR